MESVTKRILQVVNQWESILLGLTDDIISERRNHQNRTIKQLIGHLIDSASNNHQRMVRLQYTDNLQFPDYTQHNDTWIAIQNYQDSDWHNLVNLWKLYNLHIVHIISNADTSKLSHSWTDFEGNRITLKDMIASYPDHLELHIRDIQDIMNNKNTK